MSTRPDVREGRIARRTDAAVLARGVLLLMLVASLDAFNFFDRPNGGLRYTILIIPWGAAILIRARRPSMLVRRWAVGDVLIACLFLMGVAGSIIGVIFRNDAAPALSVFIPMSVGLLYLLAVDGPTTAEVRRILDGLSAIGVVYVVMAFAVNRGLLPGLVQFLKYRNANAAFVAMALTAAFLARRWGRLFFLSVLYAGIFLAYPSATQVLSVFVVGLALLLTMRRAGPLRTLVLGVMVVLAVVFALANLDTGIRITSTYFADVGKADANRGRLDLWATGLEEFQTSPWVGQAFSGEAAAARTRDQKALPFHNDFVLFLAEGGLLGSGLLLGWIVFTELTLTRRLRRFRTAGWEAEAQLTRLIFVTLNAFFVAMAFNPVMEGVTRTATIFGLYGIAMSLQLPPASDASVMRAGAAAVPSDRAAEPLYQRDTG